MHVLIIDDDPDDVDFLQGEFHRQLPSATITVFDRGHTALDYLVNLPVGASCPDLAFLDLHLPGKNGYEALTELRTLPQCSDMVVMILSTSIQDTEAEKCRAAGCDGYFSKPLSLAGYQGIIEAAVNYLDSKKSGSAAVQS